MSPGRCVDEGNSEPPAHAWAGLQTEMTAFASVHSASNLSCNPGRCATRGGAGVRWITSLPA